MTGGKPTPASTIRSTPNFDFLFGRYGHSRVAIPYFQVSMSFDDASEYLKLVGEMPGAGSMDWNIEELFQRDIDWKRVERKIAPYLEQGDHPQFFNSITIALMPIKGDVISSFTEAGWQAPKLERPDQYEKLCTFGPISAGYWVDWNAVQDDGAKLGQLSWNKREVCGIAIDGQHRLAAIKHVVEKGIGSYSNCTVPVILVVLDPSLGFTGETDRAALIGTLRQLFIDLNKHAKIPTRARQILLDDRDPASKSVRSVVGGALRQGFVELNENPPRLPLSLVDWHSEQAKFDTGPYVTTVLGLDWAVAKLLRIKPLQDMMSFVAIHRVIDTLERNLNLGLSDARERLQDCMEHERPFTFSEDDLDKIQTGFRSHWARSLIYIFTEFQPYKELIDIRVATETISPEFANWFALKQKAEDARGAGKADKVLGDFENEISNRTDHPIAASKFRSAIGEMEQLKDEKSLAFTVVFQRALILAFRQLTRVQDLEVWGEEDPGSEEDIEGLLDEDSLEEADFESDDEKLRRAKFLVDALNKLVKEEPDFLVVGCEFESSAQGGTYRFWVGSLEQAERTIDFTQAASERTADLLLLTALLWMYRRNGRFTDVEELFEYADRATSGVDLKLQQCLGRLYKNERSVAGRILSSSDEEFDKERGRELILLRAQSLWEIFGR